MSMEARISLIILCVFSFFRNFLKTNKRMHKKVIVIMADIWGRENNVKGPSGQLAEKNWFI